MMFRRFAFLCIVVITLTFIFEHEVPAQYCIGRTTYVIRDEKSKVMTVSELEKLAIGINGIELKWHRPTPDELKGRVPTPDPGIAIYQYERVSMYQNKPHRYMAHGGTLQNPLGFGIDPPGFCGSIGDLVINKSGKKMRLIFGIGEHNTHYQIDSLPFREGTFYLSGLECSDGKAPPMIDNNTVGKCLVSADNWKIVDKAWERRVDSKGSWAVHQGYSDCSKEPLRIINTQKELTEIIGSRTVNYGKSASAVDFKTEVVLVRYFYGSGYGGTEIGSFFVDWNGDLTLRGARRRRDPPPALPGHPQPLMACTLFFDSIYRSGIRSIDGKPIPPVSVKDLVPLGTSPFP